MMMLQPKIFDVINTICMNSKTQHFLLRTNRYRVACNLGGFDYSRQLQSRNAALRRATHIQIRSSPSLCHDDSMATRSESTDSAAYDSVIRNKRKSQRTSKHPPGYYASAQKKTHETIQRLLLMNSSLSEHNDYGIRDFEKTLVNAQEDEYLLRKLQISSDNARKMLIIPTQLLHDVLEAIAHCSKIDSLIEIDVPACNRVHELCNYDDETDMDNYNMNASNNSSQLPAMDTIKKKVPGPMVCALLLELIGIPQYYSQRISSPTSTNFSPTMIVHSSQIDEIIECCLLTVTALSNACRVGSNSLIGYDFNSQNINNGQAGKKKTAASLAEEIWRSVWNMQIMYTSRRRNNDSSAEPGLPATIRIGRIGFIGEQEYNPIMEYLSSVREIKDNKSEVKGFVMGQCTNSDVEDFEYKDDQSADLPWSSKDQRRYDQTVMMFNAVLDAYAKLGSSSSGTRPQIRRDMVHNCERLLLEVVAREKTKPSPEKILQQIQPDGISFNTVMKAWAGMSPKRQVDSKDEYEKTMARATAERTEAILEMMHEYCEKERAIDTTSQAIHAAFIECGGVKSRRAPSTPAHGIPVNPNTSSYNIAILAWSKSCDPDSAIKALDLFKRMVYRCNTACIAREAMTFDNTKAVYGKNARAFNAFPDSRTFAALLASLGHTSSNCKEACDSVLSVFVAIKEWDDLLQWCEENDVGPTHLFRCSNRVLNEFTYNALIRTLSRLPTSNSWDDHFECCNLIDKIIEGMSEDSVEPNAVTLGFGINAWSSCAMHAHGDKSRFQLCAEKAATHLSKLLVDATKFQSEKSVMIHSINDVIALFGKASKPMEAVNVFETAKEKQLWNLQSLATVIDSLAKNSDMGISYADKAKQYLLEFEKDTMKMSPLVLPDMKYTSLYNSVLSGYLNSNMKDRGIAQAQTLLSHMIESHESNPRHIARPNTTSFVPLMVSLARIGDDPLRCEQLLSKMEELYQRRNSIKPHSNEEKLVANVEPNTTACNALLKAYARVGNLKSALKLLGRMEKDKNLAPARPDVDTHAIMSTLSSRDFSARIYSKASSQRRHDVSPDIILNGNGINLKGLHLSGQELKPTAKSFESMMSSKSIRPFACFITLLTHSIAIAYTTSGTAEGAEKATELLLRLETMNASGEICFKPERFLHIYNNVINAWYQCEKNGDTAASASEKAEGVLDYLCEQNDKGIKALSPNNDSFHLCIKSWCQSSRPDAAERAERILRRKETFAKDHINVYIIAADYNHVIAKWKDDKLNGPERARKLFKEMNQNYGHAAELKARPNIITFNSLLDVLAKSNSRDMAEECEDLLKEMNALFEEEKKTILPDIISYRTCIDAWIRQRQKDSPRRVEALVNNLIDKFSVEGRTDLRPDSDIFNLVLKACAHTTVTWHVDNVKESDTIISIANRTYALLKGKNDFKAKPTHATYAFMFLAYKYHLDFENPRYTPLLTMLWKECCNDGLVSQFTLDSFRDSVLDYQFWNAIGGTDRYVALGRPTPDMVKVNDLPQEWRRNVKPHKKRSGDKRARSTEIPPGRSYIV